MYQQSWMETLAHLFCSLVDAEVALEEKRESLQLDAERLFEQMDDYKMGYLSSNVFARWVKANCGYTITDADLVGLQQRFDKHNDYRIGKDEFVAAVAATPVEEDEAE